MSLDNDFAMERFDGNKAYANSKLLVVYFTKELSKRLASRNMTVNCVHPGIVGTDVFREYPKWFAKFMNVLISTPSEGAKPAIYLAGSEDLNNTTGKYFCKSKQKEVDKMADDSDISEKIWAKTEELTKIQLAE